MIIRLLLLILPLLLHKAVNLKPNALCGGLSGASRICQLGCPRPGIYHPCPTAFSQLFALFCFHCVHQQSVEKKEHINSYVYFFPLYYESLPFSHCCLACVLRCFSYSNEIMMKELW